MAPKTRIRKVRVLFVTDTSLGRSEVFHQNIPCSYVTSAEALDRIKKYPPPDAVITNHDLPISELKELRKITNHHNVPLILYTPIFIQQIKDLALSLGADDYFDDSMTSLFESRIRFINRIRTLKITWLKYQHANERKKSAMPSRWEYFKSRTAGLAMLPVAVISALANTLVMAISQETKSMKDHVFSGSKKKGFLARVIGWYELLLLIPFSPVFLIMKIPLKVKLKQKHAWSLTKLFGPAAFLSYRTSQPREMR